jgi:hypothetical protein
LPLQQLGGRQHEDRRAAGSQKEKALGTSSQAVGHGLPDLGGQSYGARLDLQKPPFIEVEQGSLSWSLS